MVSSLHSYHDDGRLRVVSWNLLRRVGAGAEDVARLVKSHHPDLLLLQECTEDIVALPSLVGGHFFRHPMQSRIYGLAAWSPHPFPQSTEIRLPYSILPGRVPPRLAQIVAFRGITIANCSASEVLARGPSDHHPMMLDMKVDAAFRTPTIEDSNLLAL
jgi:exonuclease III